ncbi:proline dehydrogenase family protein [Longimicrobium terrae]|uniref:proline dehydrogenase n=1 Tax=Longimicrobium terrae TaxID=1639882 RepID=A0A841GUW7_9BACT|nr:proline dehydrogenase family protein [Longimicrobium terrae]MBB4634096.1 proline dehydrogenase [Longimicrobium terrae]MBB6069014.1 proline dehydrogenase [Longimicrobium terrae]NNC28192.1 proline dehydrogenase [Longimicrobium terrae]
MLKSGLLRLSESPTAKRIITRAPLSRSFAQRFVAGDTLREALDAARALNEAGLSVSLDFLGESVATRDEAEEAARMAIEILEAITREGLNANLSIKPTQLGLDIDEAFCRANIERVLSRAAELGSAPGEIFVRLDMESSAYTERTVALVEGLWADGFTNVGTVLQSMLRRTPEDVARLTALGSRIRLVKGAYQEPDTVAFPDKADTDRVYVESMKTLLEAGTYPALATHDEQIIDAARRFTWERGISKDSFEFQMLYGVRRDLQTRLQEEGYNVRVYVPFGDSWYPYLMRRLAERPANVVFMAGSVMREARSDGAALGKPALAIGAGFLAGLAAAVAWRRRR